MIGVFLLDVSVVKEDRPVKRNASDSRPKDIGRLRTGGIIKKPRYREATVDKNVSIRTLLKHHLLHQREL